MQHPHATWLRMHKTIEGVSQQGHTLLLAQTLVIYQ